MGWNHQLDYIYIYIFFFNSPKGWGWNGIDWTEPRGKSFKGVKMYPLNFNGDVVSVLTFWFADLTFFGGCGQWHWVGIYRSSWIKRIRWWQTPLGALRRDMGKHVRYAVSELSNWKMDQLTMHFLNEGFSWESGGSSPYSTPEGTCASPSSERVGNSKGQVLTAPCGKMDPPKKIASMCRWQIFWKKQQQQQQQQLYPTATAPYKNLQ